MSKAWRSPRQQKQDRQDSIEGSAKQWERQVGRACTPAELSEITQDVDKARAAWAKRK